MSGGSVDVEASVAAFHRDGYVLLRGVLPETTVAAWAAAFAPLLEGRLGCGGPERGPGRYYVTLPFMPPFSDDGVLCHPTLLEIVRRIVGRDAVLCQIATDTPLQGSQHQEVHRDCAPLFFETAANEFPETPSFQLAVNFPLVDIQDAAIGPVEIAKGTHRLSPDAGKRLIERGEVRLEPVYMRRGDVLIRDVRGLHRGTPNRTATPRPMVVLGYSRAFLRRPEVSVQVPADAALSPTAAHLLRHEPRVAALPTPGRAKENYDAAALETASGRSISKL